MSLKNISFQHIKLFTMEIITYAVIAIKKLR
jgi:hypothetical protein